ncbi:hypothetical protein [Pararhodobacter sp. SW119]|uniref:hypothetical protein n=1 Tax=Pararhodobacter sp. SW119 TaxID=2780075 RepID=UPI001AE0B8F5|nr:hypothetical protein [Pararhodobacter sp. SW119]
MSVTQQNMLYAMDGVVMVLDHALRIKQVGEPNWVPFRDDNPPQDPTAFERSKDSVLDRPVTVFIASDTVRATFTDLFNSVLRGAHPLVRISQSLSGAATPGHRAVWRTGRGAGRRRDPEPAQSPFSAMALLAVGHWQDA